MIYDAKDLKKAVAYDHVSAEYKDSYRKNDNFIRADCNMFDIDNTNSDNPDDWITPEKVKEAFPDVAFYVSYSRNHLKQKGDKSPRPKFHIYFPDKLITDRTEYQKHKDGLSTHICTEII